jgi:hypothetical protein
LAPEGSVRTAQIDGLCQKKASGEEAVPVTAKKLTVSIWPLAVAIAAAIVMAASAPVGAQEMSSANYKVKIASPTSGGTAVATTTTTEDVDSADNGLDITVASTAGFPSAGFIFIQYDANATSRTGMDPIPYTSLAGNSFVLPAGAVAAGVTYPSGARVSLYMSASANYASAAFAGQFAGSASVGQACTAAGNDLVMSSTNYSNVSGYAHAVTLGKPFTVYRVWRTGGTTYCSHNNALNAASANDVIEPLDNLVWDERVVFPATSNLSVSKAIIKPSTGTAFNGTTGTYGTIKNCMILKGGMTSAGGVQYVRNCTVSGDIWGSVVINSICTGIINVWSSSTASYQGFSTGNFVDFAGGDLHLRDTSSVAYNGGIDQSAYLTTDIDGNPRPMAGGWDAGADEYGSAMAVQWVYPAGEATGPIGSLSYNILRGHHPE